MLVRIQIKDNEMPLHKLFRRFGRLFRRFGLAVCVIVAIYAEPVWLTAQICEGSRVKWLAGKSLAKQNEAPLSASWNAAPLRKQLREFAAQRRVAVYVDRRVDPSAKQTVTFVDRTNEQIIWSVAEDNDLGVARIGELLYVGPKSTAARLPFVIRDIQKSLSKFGSQQRRDWLKQQSIYWNDATTSDEFQNWLQQQGITIEGQLPHDVWAAGDLALVSRLEITSIVLAGFGLSFELLSEPDSSDRQNSIRLIAFPKMQQETMRYRLARDCPVTPPMMQRRFPDLKIGGRSNNLTLEGSVETLASFEAWMVEQQCSDVDENAIRPFTVNTTATRGSILATIAGQTGREFKFDEASQASLKQRVKLDLKKVMIDQLIEACLDGTELRYRLDSNCLTIEAE